MICWPLAIFAKGYSALQLSRDLDCQYKTAFVLAHKLREALGAENRTRIVKGEVEIDGAYFGGYVKPENRKEDQKDLRLKANRSGKRRCVVVMRERGGRTLPFVFKAEGDSLPIIRARVEPGSTVYADESSNWDGLHARYDTKRVSGGTHSTAGRDVRDAMLGLMKTCRKLKLSFWDYLGHRLGVPHAPCVPALPDLLRQHAPA